MTVVATMRDASWFRRPGRARRYHVLKSGKAACGMCALFVMESEQPAHEVPEVLRCRRPGCRQAFEKARAERRTFSPADKGETYVVARNVTPTANVYFRRVGEEK
jgi:hypothetical protein